MRTASLLALCALLVLPVAAFASGGDGVDPKSVTTGTIYLKTSVEFPRCAIEGDACDPEYDPTGKTLILGNRDRTRKWVITVTPIEEDRGPVTVKVNPKDFKLKKVSKDVRAWEARKKVRNPKVKVKKPKKAEPAPEPDEDDDGTGDDDAPPVEED